LKEEWYLFAYSIICRIPVHTFTISIILTVIRIAAIFLVPTKKPMELMWLFFS
jgi:hypothetical protein